MPGNPPLKIAFLLKEFGRGGVERMVVNTANELSRQDVDVSLITQRLDTPYRSDIASGVAVLQTSQKSGEQDLRNILAELRADVVISTKLPDDRLLTSAVAGLAEAPAILFRVGNPIAHRLQSRRWNRVKHLWNIRELRRLYARADGYIAVSQGIADDLVQGLLVDPERVHVLPNPTVTPELYRLARERVDHSWLSAENPRAIIAVGNLRQQKDFSTLLRAFALVHDRIDCRLIVLGEGRQRARLRALAERLGVGRDVDLPGWVPNPYPYIRHAAVFALSSRWEGSPNALVEAAALGTPIVATNCVSGPREILGDGKYGHLVEVGNHRQLAEALAVTLTTPPPAELTRQAAEPFWAPVSAAAYRQVLSAYARSRN